MSKYYDGSEKDSEPKKETKKSIGTKAVKSAGALAGLALLIKPMLSIVKTINNKA